MRADIDLAVRDGRHGKLHCSVKLVGGHYVTRVQLPGEIEGVIGVQDRPAAAAVGIRLQCPHDRVAGPVGRDAWRGARIPERSTREGDRRGRETSVGQPERHEDVPDALVVNPVVEVGGRIKRTAQHHALHRPAANGTGACHLHDTVAIRPAALIHTEIVAIDEVDLALFPGRHEEVGVRARLVWQHDHAARAEVQITRCQSGLIPGGEEVRHAHAITGRELQDAVTIGGLLRSGDVEGPVASRHIDAAGLIGGRAGAGHPDAAQSAVRRGVEDGDLVQRRGVVPDEPSVIRTVVAVRGPRDVDHAVQEQETASVVVPQGIEEDFVADAPGADAVDGGTAIPRPHAESSISDGHRPAKLLRARGNVEGMEPLHIVGAVDSDFLRFRDDVQGPGLVVDDGSTGDADFGHHVTAFDDVNGGNSADSVGEIGEPDVPVLAEAGVVGIERVDAVVLGGDEHDVATAPTGNVNIRHIQWLRVDVAVDRIREQPAERAGADIVRPQDGFVEILPRSRVVIVVGQDPGIHRLSVQGGADHAADPGDTDRQSQSQAPQPAEDEGTPRGAPRSGQYRFEDRPQAQPHRPLLGGCTAPGRRQAPCQCPRDRHGVGPDPGIVCSEVPPNHDLRRFRGGRAGTGLVDRSRREGRPSL